MLFRNASYDDILAKIRIITFLKFFLKEIESSTEILIRKEFCKGRKRFILKQKILSLHTLHFLYFFGYQ